MGSEWLTSWILVDGGFGPPFPSWDDAKLTLAVVASATLLSG